MLCYYVFTDNFESLKSLERASEWVSASASASASACKFQMSSEAGSAFSLDAKLECVMYHQTF